MFVLYFPVAPLAVFPREYDDDQPKHRGHFGTPVIRKVNDFVSGWRAPYQLNITHLSYELR